MMFPPLQGFLFAFCAVRNATQPVSALLQQQKAKQTEAISYEWPFQLSALSAVQCGEYPANPGNAGRESNYALIAQLTVRGAVN